MANFRNNMSAPAPARSDETMQEVRDRWSGEVNPNGMDPTWNEPWTAADARFGMPQMTGQTGDGNAQMLNWDNQTGGTGMQMGQSGLQMNWSGQSPQNNGMNMQHNLPNEVIESPTSLNEAYLGSLKAMLMRNKGNYVVATFLVGTQSTVSWEGILYDVGNDYVTIYQPGRDRYIVTDMYSLKYMEFYDTRRRELCDRLMQGQNGGTSW